MSYHIKHLYFNVRSKVWPRRSCVFVCCAFARARFGLEVEQELGLFVSSAGVWVVSSA